jgi:hypothetical protein
MDYKNFIVSPSHNNVLAKVIDGEAILINVSTGAYYSLNGIGGLVWQWIEKEKNLQEMLLALTRGYNVETDTALKDIQQLLATMEKEGLITTTSCDSSTRESSLAVNISEKQSYQTPTIDIFRDMQDLLALDPPMPGLRTIPWETTE